VITLKFPSFLEKNEPLPSFHRVIMNYPHTTISDVENHVNKALDAVLHQSEIQIGHRVAVGVGSRGISHLPLIVKTLCNRIKSLGAIPIIIPAMGSHGGAESRGQVKVLESLGVTEDYCDAEILSSMDVETIDEILDGVPVYFSKDSLSMDHTLIINRIKPHTKFKGRIESGLYKMLCIGMGKHLGAMTLHKAALRHGLFNVIKSAGDRIIKHSNIRFALGVVENQHDEPIEIRAIRSADIFDEESRLLEKAKAHFPRLPFKKLDALIIGKIGKDISGSGMDPNVTGRTFDLMEDDFSDNLSVTRIALLDLSEKSQGNGIGLGNADIITEKLFRKLDYEKTLVNALTSSSLHKAFIPIRMEDDKNAIKTALFTIGMNHTEQLRVVIIKDTRHISEFWASSSLLDELSHIPEATVLEKVELKFTQKGDLDIFQAELSSNF
jgi:hypothetical protein